MWYCFDFFHRFSFVLSLSFFFVFFYPWESLFFPFFGLFCCLFAPSIFHSIGLCARLTRTHCFILYWLSIFSVLVGFKVFHHPPFITPTKKHKQKMKKFLSLPRLYLTCHLYFRIRFFKPINLTQPLSILLFSPSKKGSWTRITCAFFTLRYIIFIHSFIVVATAITTWK